MYRCVWSSTAARPLAASLSLTDCRCGRLCCQSNRIATNSFNKTFLHGRARLPPQAHIMHSLAPAQGQQCGGLLPSVEAVALTREGSGSQATSQRERNSWLLKSA